MIISIHPSQTKSTPTSYAIAATGVVDNYEVNDDLQLVFQASGTFSGTVRIEGSLDKVNWLVMRPLNTSSNAYTTSIATGASYVIDPLYTYIRLICSTYTSGTLNVSMIANRFKFASTESTTLLASSSIIGDVAAVYRSGASNTALIKKVIATATTNSTSVKTSSTKLIGWSFVNNATSTRYVKVYNKNSAPTVGTDIPVQIISIPANSICQQTLEGGVGYASGLSYAIVTGASDTDTTAVAANDVIGSLFYL